MLKDRIKNDYNYFIKQKILFNIIKKLLNFDKIVKKINLQKKL